MRRSACGREGQVDSVTRGIPEDRLARQHPGGAEGHLTALVQTVHQQFITARTGAVADHHRTRVEPLLDVGVNGDTQLRARWREKYGTWVEAPIAHRDDVTATSLPGAEAATKLNSGPRFVEGYKELPLVARLDDYCVLSSGVQTVIKFERKNQTESTDDRRRLPDGVAPNRSAILR